MAGRRPNENSISGENEGSCEGTKGWEEAHEMMDGEMECQVIRGKRGWGIYSSV